MSEKAKLNRGNKRVRGLSHKRAKQCDPRLQWLMFHKLVRMCRDIRKKEEDNATILTQKRDGSAHKNTANALLGFAKSVVPTTPPPSATSASTTTYPSPTPVCTTHKDVDIQEERSKQRRHGLCKQLCSLEDA